MDKVVLVLEGTVEGRGAAGGVQYTQNECCTIFDHYCNNGVAGQNRAGQQVEKAFADRANQVFSSRKVKGEVRAIAIPAAETLKDIVDTFCWLLNLQAILLCYGAHGQPPSPYASQCSCTIHIHLPPPPPLSISITLCLTTHARDPTPIP